MKDYKPSKATPLIATFTNIKAAGKEYMLKKHEETTIRKIISNNDAVVVSFGNPYILRPFRKAKTVIAVYDSNELAVSAFIESFSEGFKIKGRLPVKIEWIDE